MNKHSDTTNAAQTAQIRPDLTNPYLFSSACWLAFEAGRALSAVSAVTGARMSRGYSVRATTRGGNTFVVAFTGARLETVNVNRL